MFDRIRDFWSDFLKSRLVVLTGIFIILFGIILYHIFSLQILRGQEYQENYTVKIIKDKTLNSTRGNIYDRNGNLLAYNELAYAVSIQDTLDSSKEKNEILNEIIHQVLHQLDQKGEAIDNDFGITLNKDDTYSFNLTGTKQQRFLADVYGYSSIEELAYNKKLGYDTSKATAEQVMAYLCGERRYEVSTDYSIQDQYRIAVIRYNMSQNGYQKYIATRIASNVSEETVAFVKENAVILPGVEIEEDTIRKYVDSEYFASIIGYTGKISDDEYLRYKEQGRTYSLTDIIGKSGIEQYMDMELRGTKGYERVYVDNLGKELDILESSEPKAGNDVYLSIDKDLQIAVYNLLEQEIAGIVYSKIINAKEYDSHGSASDIMIPINDVYFALIDNNVIDIRDFSAKNANDTEKSVYSKFLTRQSEVIKKVEYELISSNPLAYEYLPEDMQVYESYVVNMLTSNDILDISKINSNDPVYIAWKNDEISLQEYLYHGIVNQWFDITKFEVENKYSDSEELYRSLVPYVLTKLQEDQQFSKKIYRYMIQDDLISPVDICMLLFEQKIVDYDDEVITQLQNGTLSGYDFIRDQIRKLEITPAQLALDPCTGSCVLTDVNTGELLACVSYPGYNNNKLANTVDAEYFAQLTSDLSSPFYNHATQQKTAPGSTFKMVTATAGLAEGVISIDSKIECEGVFGRVENGPKCWIWPSSTHASISVSEAIRDSCNSFFYELGWRLSQVGDKYVENVGIDRIKKYADLYGLGDATGIEIGESSPSIATEYPITAAIGQSNHNYTTISLARYVTAVANRGTVYNYTLLKQVTDPSGMVLKTYQPTVKNTMDEIPDSVWDSIHKGNLMVTQNMDEFEDFTTIQVGGKTGTAQQINSRPNHALFVGYAPFDRPSISIATRIAYGYTSHNTAAVSANILRYYFHMEDAEQLIDGNAENVGANSNVFTD